MNYSMKTLAAAGLMTLALATAARAEDTTVHVALLDMTAIVPGFVAPGAGATGQGNIGMMGRGGFGQGMMGGFGQGMMGGFGQGMPGGFGQGYGPGVGMMGAGMMGVGMMAMRADKTTVTAGTITFDVTNWSRSIIHEMVVVAVDSADSALPYDYSAHQVVEDQVMVVGEAEDMQPNATETLSLDLAAGTYLLICNVPGHYGAGMQAVFTVTE